MPKCKNDLRAQIKQYTHHRPNPDVNAKTAIPPGGDAGTDRCGQHHHGEDRQWHQQFLPEGVEVFLHRLAVDRADWADGDESQLLHAKPDWDGAWVVVWALVVASGHLAVLTQVYATAMQAVATWSLVAASLAAAALSYCLGASLAEIRSGLTTITQDDNPGCCNIYDIGGRKVLVDFAHNPHAMQALFDMAEALPAKRRALCFGQAGDRPDHAIRELARDAWAIGLDKVIVSELATYHRGREAGEVYAVIRDELLQWGADPSQIEHYDEESDSLDAAMTWAEPGDLVIMLALGGAAPIQERLKALGET